MMCAVFSCQVINWIMDPLRLALEAPLEAVRITLKRNDSGVLTGSKPKAASLDSRWFLSLKWITGIPRRETRARL